MEPKIMVATNIPGIAEFLAESYESEVYLAEDGVTLLDYTGEGDIAIITLSFLGEREMIETIYRLQMKGVRVVVIVDTKNEAILQSLMAMGVFDYILNPRDNEEILSVLETPGNIASARRKLSTVIDLMQSIMPAVQPSARVSVTPVADRLDCAFTPAGSAGKTTTTVYISAALQRFNIPVGILELDEDKPGIASIFLGHDARRDIGLDKLGLDVYRSETLLERKLAGIRIPLTRGIILYPNSGTGDGMPFEETDDVYRLFEVVQRQHPLVMVDLPVRLKDLVVLSTLRRASRVFFICEQYQPTIDACARHLEDAVKLGINIEKYVLVINKYTENSRVKVARIETALGMKAKALVPLDAERYRMAADNHKITIKDEDPWVTLAALAAGVEAPAPALKGRKKAGGRRGAGLFGLFNFFKRKSSEVSV
ncbi:MAG: hypothetical protein ACOY81_02175 [Bacillota bacterium]